DGHFHGVKEERGVFVPKRHDIKLERLPQPNLEVGGVVRGLVADFVRRDFVSDNLGRLVAVPLDGSLDPTAQLVRQNPVLVVLEQPLDNNHDLRPVGGVKHLGVLANPQSIHLAVACGEVRVVGEVQRTFVRSRLSQAISLLSRIPDFAEHRNPSLHLNYTACVIVMSTPKGNFFVVFGQQKMPRHEAGAREHVCSYAAKTFGAARPTASPASSTAGATWADGGSARVSGDSGGWRRRAAG